MLTDRHINTVESHTEGMSTRMVTGGIAPLAGETMLERLQTASREHDSLRGMLVLEPRGHAAMTIAILQPSTRPDADWGVIYAEATGFMPMCGHATIGVATTLVETNMVKVVEPTTVIRLDTAAGLVAAEVAVRGGRALGVTLTNVPAFLLEADRSIDVPGIGTVPYDMAYGGGFYPIVEAEAIGLSLTLESWNELVERGRKVAAAIDAERPPVHPASPEIRGTRYLQFVGPGGEGADSRIAVVTRGRYFDRSPCGTGTSARMAQLHAHGSLEVGQKFVNESLIGSRFTGEIAETAEVGDYAAVVPRITGRAWITGFCQFTLDPDDPFPSGFSV